MAETETPKPVRKNKLERMRDKLMEEKSTGIVEKVPSKVRKGNPAWVKGMKTPCDHKERMAKKEAVLQKTGKNFPSLSRLYMNEKGFKQAKAIAEDKGHPRQLDAIKFLAAYGHGQPTATIHVSDGPKELQKSTQEQLENVLQFKKPGNDGTGEPEACGTPEVPQAN